MTQAPPDLACRTVTPFTAAKAIDFESLERLLDRFAAAGVAVYVASGGSGEGHSMTPPELGQLYAAAVRIGRGRTPVYANPPEQHTVAATVAHVRLARDAGVELVNVYGPAGWHGYQATAEEYVAFFDEVLPQVRTPVALCPNPGLGYPVEPATVATVCARNHEVVAVNLNGVPPHYAATLRDTIRDDVLIYVDEGALSAAAHGNAAGIISALPNLIPGTFRRFLEAARSGRSGEQSQLQMYIERLRRFAGTFPGGSPRWIKLAMREMNLPGGTGGPRPPYLPPSVTEAEQLRRQALALDIPEISRALVAAANQSREDAEQA
jgi:dihydrodipicolinate synthase/N-acetylneuraminate lyase